MNMSQKMNKRRRMLEGSTIIVPHSDSTLKDRISGLPDDLILVILSHLELKDAARTSLLSKRWKYSWTFLPDLDFNAENSLGWGFGVTAVKKARYVKWVSDVVMAHRAPTVNKFRVSFVIDGTYALDIDRWVDFCSRKGVQDLELNFNGIYGKWREKFYNFGSIGQTIHHPQTACVAPNFSNLKSFSLDSLQISGASLEFMLSKCFLLERLSLVWCRGLGSFRVADSSLKSLKLKYLNIKFCVIDKVEVSVANLITVECWSRSGDIACKSVPSLVEAFLYGKCAQDMFDRVSCWSFHPEILTLFIEEGDYTPTFFPSLVNVKQLMVCFRIRKGHNLHNWRHLIDACPSLQEFTFGMNRLISQFDKKTKGRRMEATNCIHPHLEVFRFVGLIDCELDIGFASYVIKISPTLKKFILDRREPWSPTVLKDVRDRPYRQSLTPRVDRFVRELAKSHPSLDVVVI